MASVFISGSFQNHYESLKQRINEFESAGFTVLSPKSPVEVNSFDFALLRRSGYGKDMANLIRKADANETASAIRRSDILFIHNPTGRIEPLSAVHFGLALGHGKPIFTENEIEDICLRGYLRVKTVEEIKGIISRKSA